MRDGKGLSTPATLASAATTDIGAQNSVFVEISGTTGITSLGTTYNGPRFLRFTGALLLTNSASLALPGAANITTVAGDTCIACPNSASNGWNVISFQRAASLTNGATVNAAASGLITASGLTLPTATIAGRTTAGTGAVEALTAGTGISLTAGTIKRTMTPDFTSSNQTITGNTSLPVAHGLGAQPSLIRVTLVNVTAEGTFVPGNEVEFNTSATVAAQLFETASDATNVYLNLAGAVITIREKVGTAANLTITFANWKFRVRAWL